MLTHFIRLSQLTPAVALLDAWLVSAGVKTVHTGLRRLVDSKDRRDLCVFQIELRFIERQLINGLPFSLSLCSFL